jgi:RNA polymerase sigma-70 factor, ECF subfamily
MRREQYPARMLEVVRVPRWQMSQPEQRTLNSQSATLRNALLALIPNLRAFAFSLTGDSDRADDLVQDTLLKAWDHFDNFQEGTHLRAWLFTIQRNTFFSESRHRRHVSEDPDGQKANALCVHAAQHGHMDMQDFRRALDAVPPEQREALMLVAAAGFSYEEASAIVGCAIGTIKSRVHRARCKLMEVLEMDAPRKCGPDHAISRQFMADG